MPLRNPLPLAAQLIRETVLIAIAASIDYQNIPATYRHLLLLIYARGDTVAVSTGLVLRFNNDAGLNYDQQTLDGVAAVASAAEGFGGASLNIGNMAAANAGANLFTAYAVQILHYANSANNKVLLVEQAYKVGVVGGDMAMSNKACFWRNNAAMNRITMTPGAGNFAIGTVVSLYGMP